MADKKKCNIDINIKEVDNGYRVSFRCEKKPSISTRAGWVPSQWEEHEHVFKGIDEAVAHIKAELNKKKDKEK